MVDFNVTHKLKYAFLLQSLIGNTVFSTEAVKKADNIFKQTENFQYLDRALPAGRMNQAFHEDLRYIAIDGDKIILEDGHPNNLFNLINDRKNIKQLEINADIIELKDPLKLPQTNVKIRARIFKFIDDNNIAQIITSPESVLHELELGKNGFNGEDAGNIEFFVGTVKYNDNEQRQTRFILNGGMGQNGGQGKQGAHGLSVGTNFPGNFVYLENNEEIRGEKKCPTNGEDAIEAGQPGNGGDGGRFYSLIQNANLPPKFFESKEGKGGETTKFYKGGNAGTPLVARWSINGSVIECEPTVDGKLADRKSATSGKKGIALVKLVSPYSPAPFKQRLYLTDELYRKFRGSSLIKLDQLKEKYSSIVEDIKKLGHRSSTTNTQWSMIPELDQTEIENIFKKSLSQLNKLERSIDYYGQPFGFVPFVNLKTNMKIYKQKIEESIGKLHMAKWLMSLLENYKTDTNVLKMLITEKDSQRKQMISKINDSANQLHNLNIEINEIQYEEDLLIGVLNVYKEDLKRLTEREDQLSQEEFERKKKLMQAIKLGTAVARAVPVYQPALGMGAQTIDTAFDALSSSDEDLLKFSTAANSVDWSKAKSSGEQLKKDLELNKSEACEQENKAPEKPTFSTEAEVKIIDDLKKALFEIVETKVENDEVRKDIEKLFLKDNYPIKQIRQLVNLYVKKSQFLSDEIKKLNDLYEKTQTAEIKLSAKITENQRKSSDYEKKLASVLEKRTECERNIQVGRVKSSVNFAGEIYKSYSDYKKKFKDLQYKAESLEEQIEKKLSSDPFFQEFSSKIQSLVRKKSSVLKSIDTHTAIMANEITSVAQNFYQLDHIRTHFALNYARFDKLAYEFVKNMELEATESLEKQFYFLVRSYEHVLLKDYDGNLDISKIVASFTDIIKEENNGELSPENLAKIYEIYKKELKRVQDNLILDMQNNAPSMASQKIPVQRKLTAIELDILAKEGKVLINLNGRPEFDYFNNLRIDSAEIKPKLAQQEVTSLFINLAHTGNALIKSNSESNYFIYNAQTQKPFILTGVSYTDWDGEFRINNPQLNDELSFDEYGIDPAGFMPKFGARAIYEISLKAFGDNSEMEVRLEELTILFNLTGQLNQ